MSRPPNKIKPCSAELKSRETVSKLTGTALRQFGWKNNRSYHWLHTMYVYASHSLKNKSQLAVSCWSGLMTTVGPTTIWTASLQVHGCCFLMNFTQFFRQMARVLVMWMGFSSYSPLRSGDRLARTRKSQSTKHMVCSSKTLAILHFGYFGDLLLCE